MFHGFIGEYSYLHFTRDTDFIALIPFMGKGMIIVTAVIAYIVLYFSYKSSLLEWHYFLYTPISSNQVFFVTICSYTLIILGLLILFLNLMLFAMHASIFLILQIVYSILTLSLGDILFTIFTFRLLKKKYQNQRVFQILAIIMMVILSVFFLLCLRQEELHNEGVYVIFILPLIFGILGNSIIHKNKILLFSYDSFSECKVCRSYKVKNEVLSLLKIELIRNKKLLIELTIIPFIFILILKIINYQVQESVIFMQVGLASTFFIGISNSYILILKGLPYNKYCFLGARLGSGIIWGLLEYIVLAMINPKLLGASNIILLISWILILMLIVNILNIPMLKNGKEYVGFYQVISLVPSIYLIFMDIVNNFLINTWNLTLPIQLVENVIIVIVLVCISAVSDY